MPVTRTSTPAVQFSLVSNAAITLNSTQSYNLQLALSGATNRISTFLARTDRSAALTSVFGSAGTAATTFNTNVSNLLTVMSGTGLGLQVELRSAADMNGAAVAYAPSSPSGGPRIYLNVDLLSNGTSSDLISWLLLEAAGHNIDSRLNGLLDTAGDEGKAFAALLTGRTLTDSEMATYGRDPAGGVVMVNGVAVAVECEANKGPSASATALNGSFSEAAGLASQAAAVAVFSNANVSVGGANETWQRITALRFTVAGLRDGSAETVNIDGTSISLGSSSSGTTSTNGFSYSVAIANGVATISLSRSNGVSSAAVNALLNGLTYQNTNRDDPSAGTRTITLTSLSDSGGAVAGGTGNSNPNLSSTVNVVAVNDGPLATATASNNSFTEAQGLATQAAAVAVYTGANVNTIEAGQTILGLSFSVSGLRDGNAETLTIDGTTIALGANTIGVTAGNGLSYGVVLSNGTATINLSSATGLSASAANALLNGLSYQNTNRDNPSAGARTISLTSLRDSGGTANGGNDTTTPNLTSTITVLAVNDAPLLGSLAGVNLVDTAAFDAFSPSSGSLSASDPEGSALRYGLNGASAVATSFDGVGYDLAASGSYGTLYLNSSSGLYRFQPRSDWSLNALSSSGSDSFQLSVSDGSLTTSTPLVVNFTGAYEAPEQYVVVDDGAPVLNANAQILWEQALTNASRYLSDLLSRPDRDAIFNDVFGRAGTDASTFQSNLQTLYSTLGGSGLRIDVDLRSDSELNGALAAYAAVGHTGTERIYVNGDKLNSGALDLTTTVSGLLEEFAHGMDVRLNGSVDSPGDEGQLFASEVTGVTLTAEQRALIDAENDSATLTIEGVQVAVEEAATAITLTSGTYAWTGYSNTLNYQVTLDNTKDNGGDLLVAFYADTLANATLIGWQVVNRASNFSKAATYNGSFDFTSGNINTSISSAGIGVRVWEGSAGTFYGSGDDTTPVITYGNTSSLANGTATGFTANSASSPASNSGAISFTGTVTTGSFATSSTGVYVLGATNTTPRYLATYTGSNSTDTVILRFTEPVKGGGANIVFDQSKTDGTKPTSLAFSWTLADGATSGGSNTAASGNWFIFEDYIFLRPPSTLLASATNDAVTNIDIQSTSVKDYSTNANSAITSTYNSGIYFTTPTGTSVDTKAPTATLSTTGYINNPSSSSISLKSDEPGLAFLINTSVITTPSLSSISSAVTSSYSTTYVNAANTAIELSSNGLSDGTYNVYTVDFAGNLSAASANSVTVDTTAPTVSSITNPASAQYVLVGGTLSITLGFSETVKLSNAGTATITATVGSTDVTLTTTGTSSTAAGVSSLTFSAALANGLTDTDGVTIKENSLSITSGSTLTDNAGNTASSTFAALTATNQLVDTAAPTLAITSSASALKAGETATITFTFSEAPTGFTSSDISTSNGAISGLTVSADPKVYTATFTPTSSLASGSASITVTAASYTDAAGNNGGAGTTPSISIDTLAPTLAITSNVSTLKAGETATITFTFSEDPGSTFAWDGTTGDVVVTGGTLGAISGSGLTRTATFTPTASLASGSASITVAAGSYTDTAGNNGGAGTTPSISIDTLAPTLAITSNVSTLKAGETATITFTFSEDPGSTFTWNGTTGDVVVTGGTLGAISGSGLTRTATFTPTASLASGSASITVAAGSYTDTAGNNGGTATTPSISIDTLAPTLAITSSTAALRSGQTATITFSFSEDPGSTFTWDGTTGDVVVTGGTLGAISGSGLTRTATFTPTASLASGSASITVAAGSYTDTAGNNGGAGTTPSISIDTLAPTLAITSNVSTLKAGETATITFTFSEDPGSTFTWNGTTGDVVVTGGTLGAISGSGLTRTATFTPTASLASGSASITVAAASYTDAAGNNGGAGTTPSISIDTLAPTLAITSSATALKANETAIITFTFSEAPTGFAAGDISTSNGAITGLAVSADPKVYTATFTPTASLASGSASITVAASSYTDAAGNNGGAGTTPSISIDTLAPTLAITSSASALKANETAIITFTFSEAPTGFAAGDISTSNGAITGLAVSADPKVYTATFTPTASLASGSASITVAAASYTDAAGNNGGAGTTPSITIDTLAPTLAITSSTAALRSGQTATITFTFSEAPTGFTSSDISTSNGAITGLTVTADPKVYTATFTPTASLASGSASITVAADSYTDAAGNNGGAGTTPSISIDTLAPTLEITSNVSTLKAGETASLTFTLSEASTNFTSADIGATGGTISNFAGSGTAYTATFTPTADSTANGVISVASATFSDAAGNTNQDGADTNNSVSLTVDTIRPTIAIASNVSTLKAGETASLTFTLSEASTNFTSADIGATGGTISNFAGSGTAYTATFTPTADSTANGVISVASATFSDAAGNTNQDGADTNNSVSLTVDTLAPSVTITDSDPNTVNIADGSVSFTFTFSEAVTGFSTTNVTVGNGSKGTFTAVSSTVYTLVVTPAASSTGNITVDVSTNGVTDAAGNQATAPAHYTQAFDTLRPTLTITDSDAGTVNIADGTVTLTFTFSEAVTGFDASKVTVGNGSKGTFSGTGTTYTLVVTPDTAAAGNITVDVSTTGVTDAAGNQATAPDQYTQAFDTLRPTLTITDSDAGTVNIADGTVTLTFTFSEAVTGFDASKVTVGNGSKGTFSGTGTTYTLVVTPDTAAAGNITVDVSTTGVTDAAGNQATAPDQYTQAFDTLRPTLTITDSDAGTVNIADGTVTLTFTFSEAVTGFDASKVTVGNGSKGTFSGTGTTYTLVVTPDTAAAGNITVDVSTTGVTDAAGNQATAPAQYIQAFDTLRPTVTITDSDAGTVNIADGTVTLTFTFSEAVTGFDASKVTVGNGSKGTFSGTGTTYTLVVTPDTAAAGNITVDVSTTGVTDAAGNQATAPAQYIQAFDTLRPTVTITDSDAGTVNIADGTVTLTFTFSEAVTGFDASKVTVGNGSKGTFSGTGTTYTLVVTPDTAAAGNITVDVSTTGVTDAAGNQATAPDQYTQAFDTLRPTLTITDSDAGTVNIADGTVTLTFTFSEAVTGFDASKVTVGNGSKGTFSGTGTTYTLVVTPDTAAAGNITVDVSTTGVTDAAGNQATAPAQYTQVFDTLAPTAPAAPSISERSSGGINAAEVADGTVVQVSLSGTGAAAGDTLSINWGSQLVTYTLLSDDISAATASVTVPASTITAQGNGNINVSAFLTDIAGNVGANSTATSVTVDTVPPTAPSITSVSDNVAPVLGTVSNGGYTNDTVLVLNGTAEANSTVTIRDGSNPVAVGTATANGSGAWSFTTGTLSNNTVYSFNAVATDAAGNHSDASGNYSVNIDTTAPAVPTVNTVTPSPSPSTRPTLTGTTGSSPLVEGEQLTVTVNGATYAVTPSGTSWSLNLSSATPTSGSIGSFIDGFSYNVIATVTDRAGNFSSDATTDELSIVDPNPATPAVDSLSSSATPLPTLTGTANLRAGESLTVTVNGATYNVLPSAGRWSLNLATATPASGSLGSFATGSYEVIATATNGTGSGSISVSDTSSNELTITASAPSSLGSLSILRTTNGAEDPGSDGTASATPSLFTLSRTATAGALTVYYTITGSALGGTDFNWPSGFDPATGIGSVSFADGAANTTLSLPTINNSVVNGPRTITVSLQKPPLWDLQANAGSATASLICNDVNQEAPPLPTLSIADITVAEGLDTTKIATVLVTLSSASTSPVTVKYDTATSNGSGTAATASAGSDYTASSGTITILPGNTTAILSLTIIGDATVEADEVFYVALSSATNATLVRSIAAVTILNDDPPNEDPNIGPTIDLSSTGTGITLEGTALYDNITGSSGNDAISGLDGNDSLRGYLGADVLTGGNGNDVFIYANASESTGNSMDVITDYTPGSTGDRIDLPTVPTELWSAGIISAASLSAAITSVFADKDRITAGSQALDTNQAVIFTFGTTRTTRRTYLAVADSTPGYSASSDLLINITGIPSIPGVGQVTAISDYFV